MYGTTCQRTLIFTSYGAFKQSLTGVILIKFCKVYFTYVNIVLYIQLYSPRMVDKKKKKKEKRKAKQYVLYCNVSGRTLSGRGHPSMSPSPHPTLSALSAPRRLLIKSIDCLHNICTAVCCAHVLQTQWTLTRQPVRRRNWTDLA